MRTKNVYQNYLKHCKTLHFEFKIICFIKWKVIIPFGGLINWEEDYWITPETSLEASVNLTFFFKSDNGI